MASEGSPMHRILALLMAFSWLLAPYAAAQGPRRNVVVMIADDLGRDLGCYGNTAIRTPNLDGLAKRGVMFPRAYATVSSCSPSRASILTGLFTHQNGQYGLQHPPHSQQAHPWVEGLPKLLRAAGYATGLIGKYHVAPDSCYNFEFLNAKVGRDVNLMAKQARDFLAKNEQRPFFLYYAFHDPHRAGKGFGNEKEPADLRYDPDKVIVPYHLPDTPEVRKDLAEYYQSAARMDRGVGLLLEVLREMGHLDDTLIIFISDNGIPFPGAKTTLYNSGINLPLIIAGPGAPKGHTNNSLVSYIDLVPTILDFAKAKGPSYTLTGRSLLPILGEERAKGWGAVYGSHQMHEITMMYPMRTIVTDRYKLLVNLLPQRDYPLASDLWGSPSWQGIRSRGDKMMGRRSVDAFLHRPKEELYDLSKDPDELTNLAADSSHAETLADLRRRLREWQAATSDPWQILYREEKASYNR
jgi:N-sulfoglucosamine sulfohydrolase